MEILQWTVLSFAIITLLSATFIFLRHSIFGKILSNCCSQLCSSSDQHQESHLDVYNLKIHYNCDKEEVIIQGFALENGPIGLSNPAYATSRTSVESAVLSPLPDNLRSQCPSATCQVTFPSQE